MLRALCNIQDYWRYRRLIEKLEAALLSLPEPPKCCTAIEEVAKVMRKICRAPRFGQIVIAEWSGAQHLAETLVSQMEGGEHDLPVIRQARVNLRMIQAMHLHSVRIHALESRYSSDAEPPPGDADEARRDLQTAER